jgi:hypothetical protein
VAPIHVDPGAQIFLDGYPNHFGTLGLRVRDSENGHDALLTAAHVAGVLAVGRSNTDRVATLGPVIIGRSYRSIPDNADDSGYYECPVEAALIRPRNDVRSSRLIAGIRTSGSILNLDQYDLNTATVLYKCGSSTGVTMGCIISTDADFEADSPVGTIYYRSGFLVDSLGDNLFARAGDSGAVVVDGDGRVAGLLVGLLKPTADDPSPSAFCLRISDVLDTIGADLIGPA